MAPDPSGVEQAVSRTLRDNLDKLQRMSEELHQAIADLVSACASSRPTYALPPMLRSHTAPAAPEAARGVADPRPAPVAETRAEAARPAPAAEPRVAAFDLASLSVEEQEMHRRANRVAKVCMQDIKMLLPEQVQAGRAHKDICMRLRDDIEKAHREYDRRFRPIMDH